jgi:hypothetical protein
VRLLCSSQFATYTPAGTPDLPLTLTNSHTISEPSFHACVRFVLASPPYPVTGAHFHTDQTASRNQKRSPSFRQTVVSRSWNTASTPQRASPAQHQLSQPLPPRSSKYKCHSRCAPHSPSPTTAVRSSHPPFRSPTHLINSSLANTGAFELSFTPRAGALEDVAVELYLGSGATGATSTGATGGDEWMYVPARRLLRWSLASSASTTSGGVARSVSAPGRTATLRGTFVSSDAHPRPARAAQISFALPAGSLLSALKDRPA